MAVARGVDLRAAAAKASTWGTIASDPTSNALLPLISSTVKEKVDLIQNMELSDSAGRRASTSGNQIVEGTWTRHLHYQGDELLHAAALGTAGSPTQVGTTSYYTHRLLMKSSLQGIFLSLFEDRETSTYETDSAKVAGFTVSGKVGERCQVAYDMLGRNLDVAGNITWGSVTQNANSVNNHVLFSDMAWYVNAQGGGDVTSESEIGISEFSVSFKNNLEAFRTSASAPNIAEPVRNGFFECSGSITIPTYEDNNRVNDILSSTLNKMAFVFTSGSYAYKIFIPAFRFTGDIPDVSGPGRVGLKLSWEYEDVTSNPTGMNDTTPYVDIISQDSADPLA